MDREFSLSSLGFSHLEKQSEEQALFIELFSDGTINRMGTGSLKY
jgi:hypothetical protein